MLIWTFTIIIYMRLDVFLLKALNSAHVKLGKWWYSLGLDVFVIETTVVYYVYMNNHNGLLLEALVQHNYKLRCCLRLVAIGN